MPAPTDVQRALAHTSPAGLALATTKNWKLAAHLDLIDEAIVDAVAGRGPQRLVIEVPPRHGKSELISHRCPAWFLGMFPDKQVMLASYEASFAQTWGRKARDLLEEHGQALYGITVRGDARAADRWYIDGHEGVMGAAGVGGRFTGMGADLLIIDDPIKNAEEARSQVIRDKHIDWWQSTAVTRLHPGAVVIVLMTRWHKNDLGGYLLSQGHEDGGEPFTEIRLPAIAEDDDPLGRARGEALWPERYSIDLLEARRRSVGSYWWAAMYQGSPVPEGGGMFKRDWFTTVGALPAADNLVKWIRFWDFAATEKRTGNDPDWTVGALVGRHPNGTYYLADIKRARSTVDGVLRLMRQTAELDNQRFGHVKVWFEHGAGDAGKFAASMVVKHMDGFAIHGKRPTGSKEVRADPVAAQAEAGNVRMLVADWNEEFLSEVASFPQGTHDDQVDALSGAFEALARTSTVSSRPMTGGHTEPTVVRGDLVLRGERYIDKE